MTVSRRHFLVTALSAGAAGTAAWALGSAGAQAGHVWRGAALGGEACISLFGGDETAARLALRAAAMEIERLENIFSLYRDNSEIARLNRDGVLKEASRDFLEVLRASLEWREKTGGAFDPTIQPLWLAAATGREVSPGLLASAGARIEIAPDQVFLSPGAAVTLNGIAQGRIADRVTEVLTQYGFEDVIVDAGELKLAGKTPRSVKIPEVNAIVAASRVAIATSDPRTQIFDKEGVRHHLIDPKTGASPSYWRSISVFAPSAEMADGLSTAFAILPPETADDLVRNIGNVAAIGADATGRIWRMGETEMIRSSG